MQSVAEVVAYWTPEHRASAQERLPVRTGGPKAPGAGTAAAPGARQAPGGVAPVAPRGRTPPRAADARPPGPPAPAAGAAPQFPPFNRDYEYPAPYTRYEVFTESGAYAYPYSVTGTLFFTQGATRYRCSATAVASENRSLVWTAGHCLNSGGSGGQPGVWSTNVLFVPGDKDRAAPYGMWAARAILSPAGWATQGQLEYDLGAILVYPDAAGGLLVDAVGGAGIAWNLSRLQHWHDFGYPSVAPFTGDRQIVCAASHAADDQPSGDPVGPPTVALGCDMTGGASGGGWQVAFGRDFPGAPGYVNSVNSYKYIQPAMPEEMYGPYHGDAAANLYTAVRDR